MLYPNLTAEYETGCKHLDSFAADAETTSEVMHDVFYGDGDLTYTESILTYSRLTMFPEWWEVKGLNSVSMSYLFSPVVSIIDMSKNKNKYRAYMLMKKIEEADALNIGADADGYVDVYRLNAIEQGHRREIEWARKVLNNMLSGGAVRYAFYRRALTLAKSAIDYVHHNNRTRRSIPIKQEG